MSTQIPATTNPGGERDGVLDIRDLSVTFQTESGTVAAVRGVDVRIHAGETVALVGESGSGKSTVAFAAMGLLATNATAAGEVSVAGTDIVTVGEPALEKLRGSVMSMVFQEPATALNPLVTIGRQVSEVITNHASLGRAEAAQRAVELLRMVGIPEPELRAKYYPFQLSGGQRQRVVIAMAIANRPQLLIADEPTTALDVTVQAEILDLLRRLALETGTGVLLVTHNMGVVADFADRVAVMYNGEIVEEGAVEDILLRPTHDYTKRLLAAVPRLQVAARPEEPGVAEATAAAPEVLALENVSVTYGRGARAVKALDSVSLSLQQGTTLGLVGESGSGKSTAGRVALGLIKPNSGSIRLLGESLEKLSGRRRARLRASLGVVLQDPVASLDPRMTVADCVAEPLFVHARIGRAERDRRVREALEAVHLTANLANRSPHELSGGQRQRVSIARALILRPRLLVADEPTSALDVSVQQSVLGVLTELQSEFGFACLFISHDLAVVQELAQNVVVMRSGRVEEVGRTDETLVTPRTEYTKRLLAAVPVPDPILQRERRIARRAAMAETSEAQTA